ncbi:glycosyltransferase family 2 protein [Dinoroseobacter sp. S76]|uniref:glycosyltransferase family 2 protein n=1 Tax=Dinoroseobacter sp. S76 TaxID=3415124 RepID=UPI003C7D08B3
MPATVALLVVASNEGAYLAEFLHHHLAMGFAPIVVVTNNCTDSTVAVTEAVMRADPRIRRYDGDWIWQQHPPKDFQMVAYRAALETIRAELGPGDYLALLDVDEFWAPLDGTETVQAHLAALDHPDVVVASWFVPDADQTLFAPPLKPTLSGRLMRQVKSIWRADLELDRFNPHFAWAKGESRTVFLAGVPLDPGTSRLADSPSAPGDAVIVHHMFRSRVEYLAFLRRGNPTEDGAFKTNRHGYDVLPRSLNRCEIDIAPGLVARQDGLAGFLTKTGSAEATRAGKRQTLARAVEGGKAYLALPRADREAFKAPFRNLPVRRTIWRAGKGLKTFRD